MLTESVWKEAKTFFAIFYGYLNQNLAPTERVCVVGASDGKFVLPLAREGRRVEAIEVNSVSLDGGTETFPGGEQRQMLGLKGRLTAEGLSEFVTITEGDFLVCSLPRDCGAVFTSCSWHYSRNHHVPLATFLERMRSMLRPGGIFCAEYMMPVEEKHLRVEHYLRERDLRRHFDGGWRIIEEFFSEPFEEAAHVGNLKDHVHRMGFFMAKRPE